MLPAGLEPSQGDAQLPLAGDCGHGALDGVVAAPLGQQVHMPGDERHQFACVLVEKQVHVNPLGVERVEQSQQRPFGPAQLHVVHVDKYPHAFHDIIFLILLRQLNIHRQNIINPTFCFEKAERYLLSLNLK